MLFSLAASLEIHHKYNYWIWACTRSCFLFVTSWKGMLQEITFGLETPLVKFPARKHAMSVIFVGQGILLIEDAFAYYLHTRKPSGFIP